MRFITFAEMAERFKGKEVAIVGSAPSCLDNKPGIVDGHDVVVRVNNYRVGPNQGYRCDAHYSFYGRSIRKTASELRQDGVKLCMCKCPDGMPLESEWHVKNRKLNGIDFRYIYRTRLPFWFCDTYVPSAFSFLEKFFILGKHVPTTGFAAILDVLACEPKRVWLTGFDFFRSKKHNVNERWTEGDPDDPIGHRPGLEADWLAANAGRYPLRFDSALTSILGERKRTERAAA